ncbi:MAG: hypothetical protein Q4G33_12780 [bacterium]|nr:hypothetical protein [bacterium]
MNVYINAQGDILAVFASDRGGYKVYIRAAGDVVFKTMPVAFRSRETREEAEGDMHAYVRIRCREGTWRFVENWKG